MDRNLQARYAIAPLLWQPRESIKNAIGAPGGEEIVQTATIVKIGAARTNLADCIPHLECPDCQACRPESCERCCSRGWINRVEAAALAGGAP